MSTAATNPKPASVKSVDLTIWRALGGAPAMLFGEECASVAVWTVVVLLWRSLLYLSFLEPFVPYGVVYALPLVAELLGPYFPLLRSNFPILPYRLAECFMGKILPSRMLVLVPAHLIGAIFGVVTVKTVIPFLPTQVLRPIEYPPAHWAVGLALEIVVNFLYCLVLLVLPYVLDVNRVKSKVVSVVVLPIMLCRVPAVGSTLNPSIVYALWYLHNASSLSNFARTLPFEHILGPLLGAVLAGMVCNAYFPDDSKSWTRSPSKL